MDENLLISTSKDWINAQAAIPIKSKVRDDYGVIF